MFNVKVSDIAEVVMGQSPKAEDVNREGLGFPLLNGPTEFTSRYPVPVQYTTEGKRFSKAGDILFCVRGSTTGRMNYADQKYAIGRGIAAIRGKDGYPTPYVRAVIEGSLDRLLASATGSTFPNVGRELLSDFEVEAVPVEKALAINEFIVSLESKIELNRQTNQTLEQIAQAIFKSWFVDFEPTRAKIIAKEQGANLATQELAAQAIICGAITLEQLAEVEQNLETTLQQAIDEKLNQHNQTNPTALNAQQLKTTAALFPNELVESELGYVPKGWEVKTIKDLSTKISKGTTPRRADIQNAKDSESIIFLKVRDISDDGEITRVNLDTVPESIHMGALKRSILETHDILFSIAGTIGRVAVVDKDLSNSNCNQAVAFIRLLEPAKHLEICRLNLVGRRVQDEVAARVVQGVQANFSLTSLGEVSIVIPSEALLSEFNSAVVTISNKRKNLMTENRALVDIRDLLLPKLLSGELAVPDSPTPAVKAKEA